MRTKIPAEVEWHFADGAYQQTTIQIGDKSTGEAHQRANTALNRGEHELKPKKEDFVSYHTA